MARFYTLICILFFSMVYLSAQSTDGFWGLKYGMTKAQVEGANIRATITEKDRENLYIKDVSFGGIDFDYGMLSFYKDQLYTGYFMATLPIKEASAVCVKLSKILIDRYGLPLEKDLSFMWTSDNKNAIVLTLKPDDQNPSITLLYSCEKIRLQKESDESQDF